MKYVKEILLAASLLLPTVAAGIFNPSEKRNSLEQRALQAETVLVSRWPVRRLYILDDHTAIRYVFQCTARGCFDGYTLISGNQAKRDIQLAQERVGVNSWYGIEYKIQKKKGQPGS